MISTPDYSDFPGEIGRKISQRVGFGSRNTLSISGDRLWAVLVGSSRKRKPPKDEKAESVIN